MALDEIALVIILRVFEKKRHSGENNTRNVSDVVFLESKKDLAIIIENNFVNFVIARKQ